MKEWFFEPGKLYRHVGSRCYGCYLILENTNIKFGDFEAEFLVAIDSFGQFYAGGLIPKFFKEVE